MPIDEFDSRVWPIRKYLNELSQSTDNSAVRTLIDGAYDIVDSVQYDYQQGNYTDEDPLEVCRQQIVGSIEELACSIPGLIIGFQGVSRA